MFAVTQHLATLFFVLHGLSRAKLYVAIGISFSIQNLILLQTGCCEVPRYNEFNFVNDIGCRPCVNKLYFIDKLYYLTALRFDTRLYPFQVGIFIVRQGKRL